MSNEMAYVSSDREALQWAIGCVVAAHITRVRQLGVAALTVRAAGAALALFFAFDVILPSLVTAVYSVGALGHVGFLAGLVPGDDLGRLVPLVQAIPTWLHLLLVAAAASYAAAAGALFGRSSAARVLLVVGMGLSLTSSWLARGIVAPVGPLTPDPSLLSTIVVPVALPLLAAIVARPARGRS
jgi:hypothetical protein